MIDNMISFKRFLINKVKRLIIISFFCCVMLYNGLFFLGLNIFFSVRVVLFLYIELKYV